MMEDMGLSMVEKKPKTISMARGKRMEKDVGLKLSEDVTIEDQGDRLYKFLGVEEAEQHENKVVLKKAEKEVIRRVSVILDTPMSDQNKINAINTFALPVLTFYMPIIFFSQKDLNEADLKVKRLLTERGARHPQHLNTMLHASRSIGRRGLKQISSVYKETKIKAALRLTTSNDSRLQAVAQFQQIKENKGRRSIFKDARRHAMEMALDLELGEDKRTLSMKTTEGRTYTASYPAGAKKIIAKGRIEKSRAEIKESKWQGNIVSHRLADESLDLAECFNWSRKWRSAPTYTICAINEIIQQLVRTKVREELMGKTTNTSCRLCNKYPETVEHILSGCPELAQRHYLWRHNDALKHVLSALLLRHGIRERHISPKQETRSYYTNREKNIEIMWDCSVTTGTRMPDEGNWPDLQVINKREEKIDVVEMACPSWRNRAETDERKTRKYTTVREELEERYPGYEVRQTNIVVDILGGFDRGLMDVLSKIIGKVAAKRALESMQKTILLRAIRLMRLIR